MINLVLSYFWVFDTHERQDDRSLIISTIPIPQDPINIQIHHFKATFMCPRSISGVLFDSVRRFRPSLLLHTTVTVPDVIGVLAVWRHNKQRKLTSPRSQGKTVTIPQYQFNKTKQHTVRCSSYFKYQNKATYGHWRSLLIFPLVFQ